MTYLRKFLSWLAGPWLLFWLLPVLMLLITVGTIAQKYIGLYEAERTFFGSLVFWAGGWLPLPGALSLLGLLGLSLLAKFLLYSSWTWARAGLNLAHCSILVLLLGGLASSLLAQDGFMSITEGEHSAQLQDYHIRELMLVQDRSLLAKWPRAALRAGQRLQLPDTPIVIDILAACRNCAISAQENPNPTARSMAKGMALSPAPLALQDEANVGGITFKVSGAGAEQDGLYILFEDGPTTKLTTAAGQTLELVYGKQQRTLPFTVELKDFVKTAYPGTDTAKAYHSDVIITDGALSWPARIEMNKPLRYRGYTLYQSAFVARPGEAEMSILAVSRDAGQFLPYLGTGLLALGLLLHLFLRRRIKDLPA